MVGLGSMGAGIARSLLRNGWPLRVFARRPDAAEALVAAGAHATPTLADLGRKCSLVILSLPDAAAVEHVLFGSDPSGSNGLCSYLVPGSCVIDTSTIPAESIRAFGQRLADRDIDLLDAPVSGGQQGAEDGQLSCMVGGQAHVLDKCREAMQAFCKSITHVGALGAGQTVKACNQVAVAAALLGVADALTLAHVQGIDPQTMSKVLMEGAARSFSLEKHAPRIIGGHFAPGFRARLMRKDLRIALASARSGGATLPTTMLAEQLLDSLCASGRADWDWCALALQIQIMSGIPVSETPEPVV
jgi:3-hydroxyisobutyrate dehydrogenase-like beta-hydroxyacid dehydrogenase